jgi:hypothetical protein
MIIEHIDAIARKKQRTVLCLYFRPESEEERRAYNYEHDIQRQKIIEWLDVHKIGWQPCGRFANENGFESYKGELYLDVPFDEQDGQYCLVRDYLEFPDGAMRFQGVQFYFVPLETAMENAHHDEPGFWERWAEDF